MHVHFGCGFKRHLWLGNNSWVFFGKGDVEEIAVRGQLFLKWCESHSPAVSAWVFS